MERDNEMNYLARLRYFASTRAHLQTRLEIRKLLKEKPEILQVGFNLKDEYIGSPLPAPLP